MRRRKALGYDPGESPDDLKKLIGELTVQYVQCKRPKADKEPAVRDEAAHERRYHGPSYIGCAAQEPGRIGSGE